MPPVAADMTPIYLVVFDLGGVIVRAARSFEEACALAGCGESPLVTDEAFLGRHAQAIAAYMAGRISTDAYAEACEQASDGRLTRATADVALTDLSVPHRDLRSKVSRLDVVRWGHAMVRPKPGFLFGGARAEASKPYRRCHFAHLCAVDA